MLRVSAEQLLPVRVTFPFWDSKAGLSKRSPKAGLDSRIYAMCPQTGSLVQTMKNQRVSGGSQEVTLNVRDKELWTHGCMP